MTNLDSWLCRHSVCFEPKEFASYNSSVDTVACAGRSKAPVRYLTRFIKLAQRVIKSSPIFTRTGAALSIGRDQILPDFR